MLKNKVQFLSYLPEAKSFSELEKNINAESDGEVYFDVSDNGKNSENMYLDFYAQDMFLFILKNLKSEREIILFLLQIVRDEYKKFTYDELAGALKIHRVRYMQELRKTKDVIKDILDSYNELG